MTWHEVDEAFLKDTVVLRDGNQITLKDLLKEVWQTAYDLGYKEGHEEVREWGYETL